MVAKHEREAAGRQNGEPGANLPRLALIADRFTEPSYAHAAVEAVRGGVRWVHLRDHVASPSAFASAARRLTERLRGAAPDVRLSVNTRVDVARALGLDVHVGTRGPAVVDARAMLPDATVGYSAHSLDETQQAQANGAAYVFFSPIFPTASKPGHPGAGLDALRAVCQAVAVPVVALGGVTPATAPACLDAGAHGIAVLSGILHAADPAAAAHAYASLVA
ncbi:MAG: thiamine phosphate synthase [Bacteroidota bacterium]